MKSIDWLWAGIESVLWYTVIYYSLYSIKNPVILWQSAFILLVLSCLAVIACPWVRNSNAWKEMWQGR